MSKYTCLWEAVGRDGRDFFILTFDEVEHILGVPLDHAFLQQKKELYNYGYTVGKISLKNKTVEFRKTI